MDGLTLGLCPGLSVADVGSDDVVGTILGSFVGESIGLNDGMTVGL